MKMLMVTSSINKDIYILIEMNRRSLLKILAFMMVVLTSSTAIGQQDPSFTQYMYNTMTVNPAYAGTRDVLSANLLYRSQWIGIEGAPQTQTLTLHSPISDGQMGLGFNVINDQIGPVSETKVNGTYSYILPIDRYTNISFGINAGAELFNIDFSELNIFDEQDASFQNNVDNKISPQVGLGAMIYNDLFYVSLSAPRILRTEYYDAEDNSNTVARSRVHYYLTAGYVFDVNDNIRFKPSILSRYVSGSPLRVDVSANFLINDEFSIGASYRLSSSYGVMTSYQISDTLLAGVSYDRDSSELRNFNDGTFEIFLRFELFKKYRKMYTPRFF